MKAVVETVPELPAKAKRDMVKSELMDDPDVFGDKGVRHAAALAVTAAVAPRLTKPEKRYTSTYADVAIAKGIEFAAALETARRERSFTASQERELDEIVGSILDAYKGVEVS